MGSTRSQSTDAIIPENADPDLEKKESADPDLEKKRGAANLGSTARCFPFRVRGSGRWIEFWE